jgi:hypothetical protein
MRRRPSVLVSFILATRNRRDCVVETLKAVGQCGLDRADYEVIVVDNASTDGTPEAVRDLADCVVPLRSNRGSCAKAWGAAVASGRYWVFLDDDARPRYGSIPRMFDLFRSRADLAAAGFTIHLPDGAQECSALPGVFHGCCVGLRADAVRQVGGLDPSFFMQAEEYDLCFRLVNAGWSIGVFDELHADHFKASDGQRAWRAAYYDVRNNLRLAVRYIPRPAYRVYREDWLQRYAWLAERYGEERAFRAGRRNGRIHCLWERRSYGSDRLSPRAFEFFFRWEEITSRMGGLVQNGIARIVLADLGKNVYAFYQAARRMGVEIIAVADERLSAADRTYRGVPIIPLDDALNRRPDAVVVANMAPAFAEKTTRRLLARIGRQPAASIPRTLTHSPAPRVFNWFGRVSPLAQPTKGPEFLELGILTESVPTHARSVSEVLV